MKSGEIEKICRNIRRSIGKPLGYRQSDYINWKFKEGYFFCICTFDLHDSELSVKPIFMDDLYWKIIYPEGRKKLPDSLRGNGALSHLCENIWETKYPDDLNCKNFSAELYERLIGEMYSIAELEIEKFLKKYPDPNRFDKFLVDNDEHSDLGEVLLLINNKEYAKAYDMAISILERGTRCSNIYVMEWDDGEIINKREFEFIKEHCIRELHSDKA